MKKFIAATALSATLLGGALVVGGPVAVAGAQTAPKASAAEGAKPGRAHRQQRRHRALRSVVATSAKVLGMKPADLAKELKAGKSIADVAKTKGVDVQKVEDALVAKATARIDAAVKAGKLTPERAAKAKARLPKLAERIVDHHKGDRPTRPTN